MATELARQRGAAASTPYYRLLEAAERDGRDLAAAFLPQVSKYVQERRALASQLRSALREVEAELSRWEAVSAELVAVGDPDAPEAREGLRGKAIGPVAIQVLRDAGQPQAPIHYAKWFELVEQAGHRIGGKDPVASFLTALTRTDGIESVGARSGLYRLQEVEG